MRQTANLTAPFKLSFLSLSIALGMGVTASLSSSAEESGQAAKDISDLKGHVVKVGQDGSSSKDSDTQKDKVLVLCRMMD